METDLLGTPKVITRISYGKTFVKMSLRRESHTKLKALADSYGLTLTAFIELLVEKLSLGLNIDKLAPELPQKGRADNLSMARQIEQIKELVEENNLLLKAKHDNQVVSDINTGKYVESKDIPGALVRNEITIDKAGQDKARQRRAKRMKQII